MTIIYYTLDTETNGLNINSHHITEFSIIRNSDKLQLSKNVICPNPHLSSLDALKITRKSIQDLSKGISQLQATIDITNFLNLDKQTPNSRCIVGHNVINFDKKFLHKLFASQNLTFPANLFLDTLHLMKHFLKLKNIKAKSNLNNSLDILQIKKFANNQHSAKTDSRNNFLLLDSLINQHNINPLPFIKSFPHVINDDNDNLLNNSIYNNDDINDNDNSNDDD